MHLNLSQRKKSKHAAIKEWEWREILLVSYSKPVARSINEDGEKGGKQKDHHTVRFPPSTHISVCNHSFIIEEVSTYTQMKTDEEHRSKN